MTPIARLATAGALAALASCANGAAEMSFCASDAECSDGMVCFVDGCGDPGRDIVVEVVPGATSGQLAQDFRIENVQAVQDIEAFEPAAILGVVQQEILQLQTAAYTKQVLFRAYGKSSVIPGRSRSVQYTMLPEVGAYELAMPTGIFNVSVTPLDPADAHVPPQHAPGVIIQPGQAVNLNFTFPAISPDALWVINGKLLKKAMPEAAITEAVMEIQAFDPVHGTPVSQRARVSSGQEGSTGDFVLYVQKRQDLARIELRAAPQETASVVPSKSFQIAITDELRATNPWNLDAFELGDFGAKLAVTGRVVDPNGQPVAGANVYVDGPVQGGGTFRGQPAITALDGTFEVAALPSATGKTVDLLVVPTPKSSAGLLRKPVVIPAAGVALGDVVAPAKVEVVGRILDPDGEPAPGVLIEVEPFAAPSGTPLPSGVTRATSDAEGAFTLRLDPGVYRMDFLPADLRPRVSRFVTVEGAPGPEGLRPKVELPDFALSNGRRVTGTISSIPRRLAAPTPVPAPYATVKFFRVVNIDGEASSVLLAEGVADALGNYSVVLPAARTE